MPSLFDPSSYADVRKPLLEAQGLPPACYTDAAFYAREQARVFQCSWIMVGRLDQIPKRGDYFTAEFAGVKLFIIRDLENQPRAYANTCRHRGAALISGRGNCRAVVCPYHSWTYALDGSLRGAAGMEQTVGFEAKEHGLHPARVESWGGFIFVCLDPLAPPLSVWLGELPQRLAMYGFDAMVATRRAEFTVACNWKLWVENFMEGYHIPTVHRSTISKKKAINHAQDAPADGQFETIWEVHDGTLALLDDDEGFPPIETLTGDLARGSRFILVYPSTMFAITIDAMWSFECHPLGPQSTKVVLTSCFPKSRTERPDFAELAQNYYKRQDIVVGEDNDISEVQQRGLDNVLAAAGRFSFKEKIVHALDNWVLDRVLNEPAEPAPVIRLVNAA